MSRSRLSLAGCTVALLCGLTGAALAHDAAAPSSGSGVRAEMLMWVQDAEDKLIQLAAATPEAKYSWRPSKGVRSMGEVFMHVASANYGAPASWGVKPPDGFNFATHEKSLTKKAAIEKELKASFAHMRQGFESIPEADLGKETELFGMKMSIRAGYMLLLSHAHEHLGQSIAYARTNGIVPPWTAKQQQAMKAEEKTKTDK